MTNKGLIAISLFLLTLLLAAPAAFAADPKQEQAIQIQQAELEYKLKQAEAPPAGEGEKPSRTGLTVIPQYVYSHNTSLTTNLNDGMGGKLEMDSGHSNGISVTALGTKEFNDSFALTLMYQYIYSEYSGGGLHPESIPGLSVSEDTDVSSHGIGLIADINLKKFGRVQGSFIQGFDYFGGEQKNYMNGQYAGSNSMDNFSERISSLMLWYEYDIPVSESWTLTPYAGWRSIYAHLNNPQGEANPGTDNCWVHLMSGGLKAGYQDGLFGFGLRGGVNYRASYDDIPGFAIRAPAQNVAFPAYNVTLDRTVGTVGANVNYAIPGYCVLFAGYDGLIGSNTDAHMLTTGVMIPF